MQGTGSGVHTDIVSRNLGTIPGHGKDDNLPSEDDKSKITINPVSKGVQNVKRKSYHKNSQGR